MLENQNLEESIKKLMKEQNQNAFIEMAFNLLESKVYTVFHESTLLSLDRNGVLPSNRVMDPNVFNKLYFNHDDRGDWIVLFVSKEISNKLELPNDAVIGGLEFYHLCNLYWSDRKEFAGFKLEIEDFGIELSKEAIKDMCLIKELKDKD